VVALGRWLRSAIVVAVMAFDSAFIVISLIRTVSGCDGPSVPVSAAFDQVFLKAHQDLVTGSVLLGGRHVTVT
jgi:hypothetical protein